MSPIILKDFNWSQTEDSLRVNVKGATGITKRNLDVFTSDIYVKMHSPPFFWELFLTGEIEPESSQVAIDDGVITLTLTKKHKGLWNEIAEHIQDKSSMQLKRQKAVDAQHRHSAEREADKQRKWHERKTALMEQRMKLEEDERRNTKLRVEADKMEALQQAMSVLKVTQSEETGKGVVEVSREIPAPREHSTVFVSFTATPNSAVVGQ